MERYRTIAHVLLDRRKLEHFSRMVPATELPNLIFEMAAAAAHAGLPVRQRRPAHSRRVCVTAWRRLQSSTACRYAAGVLAALNHLRTALGVMERMGHFVLCKVLARRNQETSWPPISGSWSSRPGLCKGRIDPCAPVLQRVVPEPI